MFRVSVSFVSIIACVALSGCEQATCESVARHNAKIIVNELGAASSQFDSFVRIERERCQERGYTVAQMECIVKANTARGIDRCLGQ